MQDIKQPEQKTLITIDETTGTQPFIVKKLSLGNRYPSQHSRHKTAEEAIAEIERLEREAPGKYTRVTPYRMAKYASAY